MKEYTTTNYQNTLRTFSAINNVGLEKTLVPKQHYCQWRSFGNCVMIKKKFLEPY